MGNLLIGFTIAFLSSREGQEIAKKVAKKVLENLSERFSSTFFATLKEGR